MVSLQKGQTVRLEKSGGGTLTRVSMELSLDVRKSKRLTRTGGGWQMTAIGQDTNGRTFHDMMPSIVASL